MKVEIMTLHYIWHYGSLLQTYATCRMFEKIGIDAEVIDYIRPNASEAEQIREGLLKKNLARNVIKKNLFILSKKIEKIRRKKFSDDFLNKYVRLSRRYSDYSDICDNPPLADIYCTGSDQTWNSEYNGGFLPEYYLQFAPKGKKKIGFAVSIGMDAFPVNELEQTKKAIYEYSAISVREASAEQLIRNLGYNNIIQILDPTLCLSFDEWKPLISKRLVKDRYVLIYKLNENPELEEFASTIAKRMNCRIIRVSYYINHFRKQGKMIYSPSVEEFLSQIYYAECVITDSFHCVAFSLNFNKDFYAFYPARYSTRIQSILELTNTENRAVGQNKPNSLKIDYEYVNKVLDQEREKALNFLKENCN